jgi:amidophosphoribosyltransferase
MGHTPLIIGKMDGEYAVASETCSFSNLGFKIEKYVGPGEIVLLTADGLKQQKEADSANKICAFLWIYTGYPASSYEGISVEAVRERSGKLLANNDPIEADFASGVPDSGTAHGIGYAMGAGIPFRRPLVKYTAGYGRSYTPPSQEIRDMVATMKLIPIKEVIKGHRMVLCEDSIVRGTQLRNFTVQKLWENEAKEVHIRVACPPLMFPCRYTLSTRSINELAARRAIKALEGKDLEDVSEYVNSNSVKFPQMVEWIKNDLGVTSLRYQSLDDMLKAIGLPKESLCLYCWCGK